MTKFLISFPSSAMALDSPEEWAAAGVDSRAVIQAAKDAGVYVFGGGIDEAVAPVRVAADGTVTAGTYPETERLEGGYTILELPSREVAFEWAAKIAAACRCEQEVREFMYDPMS
ncbi:YciI family protein [Agromyces seonyuensis]|uniref:Transcription initiation protein n=1 Tax=Agromyces seonyuensis TaxID=2662446 RepID=A0A6I4P0B2_9MICO|nr:YciI family protein [Agromyces seonyuensis]MWB99990.1 transcription initiation protein [Agromyces seonyuensis]